MVQTTNGAAGCRALRQAGRFGFRGQRWQAQDCVATSRRHPGTGGNLVSRPVLGLAAGRKKPLKRLGWPADCMLVWTAQRAVPTNKQPGQLRTLSLPIKGGRAGRAPASPVAYPANYSASKRGVRCLIEMATSRRHPGFAGRPGLIEWRRMFLLARRGFFRLQWPDIE